MSDSPPDPELPSRTSLPGRRPDGEKPRSFADHTAAPIDLPADGGLLPAPSADGATRRPKVELPSQRHKDRGLPSLTPAAYQPDPPPSPPSQAQRTDLPQPRRSDEHPKFRPPQPGHDPGELDILPIPPTAPPAPPPDPAAATPPATPRPVNHRLAANRRPEFVRQVDVEPDPETTQAWGGVDPDSNQRGSRRLLLWAALIGLPLVAITLWQSLGRPGMTAPTRPAPVAPAPPTLDPAEETRQAGEFARRFLATATLDERAAMVRHPEITRPRMEAWHSDASPLKPNQILGFDDRSAEQTIDGLTFIMLTMELDDRRPRAIALEKLPGGGFLVDWESFVFWSHPKWPEFLSKEPDGSFEFRVVVSPDTYFNFGYADPQKWFCFKLQDPENWAHAWGYCQLDSDAGIQLNRMLRRQRQQQQNDVKAILKLKFEDAGRGRNQVLIEEVVQDGWIKTGS